MTGRFRRWARRHGWDQRLDGAIASPRALFISAMVLVLVPTLYTIRPGKSWFEWAWLQAISIAAFVFAALVAQYAGARQFARIVDLIRPIEETGEKDRTSAGTAMLEGLLDTPGPTFREFQFRVYMMDIKTGTLNAIWSPKGSEGGKYGWKPGEGVVGHAYLHENIRIAFNEECWDSTYNVPQARAPRYEALKSVAAVPCKNARKQVVAVLAASSTVDNSLLRQLQPQSELLDLAAAVSRVLIDVLRVQSD